MLGKPHSIIRHANMPRCVFKLVWDAVQSGREIFGYVVNKTIDGNYYWVLAHITPSYNNKGEIVGYHSNRRVPDQQVLSSIITPLYAELLVIESQPSNRKDGMNEALTHLQSLLQQKGQDYDEFILTL